MAGTQFVDHEGRKVLLISMANCDQAQSLAIMEEAMRLVEVQPPKSLITITQVDGMEYTPATVRAVHDFAQHNEPWVTVGIVVGVSGIRKVIFDSVVKATGRRLYSFDTMEQARIWLGKHVAGKADGPVEADV